MKRNIAALLAGLVFGFGLALSQITKPTKVLAFLDVAGNWDPSLLLVMAAAVTVTFLAYRLIVRRPKPLLAERFFLPTKSELDRPLIAGAAVFGVGWGIAGYCPGPGIAALGLGTWEAPLFAGAMALGALTYRWLFERPSPGTQAAAGRGQS